ncbi:caffeoyl-CoA O-methyltransferase [Halteromyces radiatus]|uniref:caffeoyl-CoA O-methyltransferase n=1 Tax=Halteromyces radiatus TaxID=101107 RepID=UPI00221FB71C|nr:caffeoyl-CoA O-methyltransferase [Halteromyces radiatus]KAI8078870.1 caffeoyl-CoA O-methyltransferase [Halteromyces radiatus]
MSTVSSSIKTWEAVDDYFTNLYIDHDPVLQSAIETSEKEGLPGHNVTATQGKFLQMLCTLRGAERVLEIGTLGGYSAIWMARALPKGGKLVTLEANPDYARIAQQNVDRAQLTQVVEIKVGKALDTLPQLEGPPFDLVFIDADKGNNPHYYEWALKLAKPGTIIIVDNIVRYGRVLDNASPDQSVQGIRRFNEIVANDPRVHATALQTVGAKGYDGFAMLLVK